MEQPFNVLYYSNSCKHSAKILDFIVKNGFAEKVNCICVDKRTLRNGHTWVVQLDDGRIHTVPPHISRVPSLLLVNQKNEVRLGNEILEFFQPAAKAQTEAAQMGNGEPNFYAPAGFSDTFSAYV